MKIKIYQIDSNKEHGTMLSYGEYVELFDK